MPSPWMEVQSRSRQPLLTPVPPPHNASSWKRPGRGRRREISSNPSGKPVVVSRYFLPSHASSLVTDAKSTSTSSSTATPDGGKPVVVSRYFLPSHASSSLVTDAKSSSTSSLTATPDGGKPVVVSRYFLPSHASSTLVTDAKSSISSSTATQDGGKPVVVSRYFLPSHASSSVITDAKASGPDGKKPTVKRKRDNPNIEAKKVPHFSAAQKKSEAYRRVADNNTWDPPASCYHLLQERHSFDPWRVLLICMLLNVTTGRQVARVLPGLFLMCPNAEAMSKVDEEEMEKVIHSLGLQKKRSNMLKRFSCEYLRDDWIYVTQLHGIGKYAADAYAIFCTGKMEQITPRDHKLVAYWKFVCGKEEHFES
ncbi:methyl-CpG-binding domain protein 4-like protein isoform X2 [Zingiber officinale]|uniref:Uncharacterized protein n=1 Tax=Zingiber officinale TaxID=94328 RepID=A0A8J5C550_ZINOF|nr:methyl-CpG-binding domain protein 4-like protein isoform X1 [Zingiber officinale]XP_042445247.1 methyl-CpG-binding domain protein 4-like protein isoform X2 [Zingiber officinale]KAG6472978.1 hypothetical protein ZIOFF_070458 [Zingiber officinale]